jgi:hypothetical protein
MSEAGPVSRRRSPREIAKHDSEQTAIVVTTANAELAREASPRTLAAAIDTDIIGDIDGDGCPYVRRSSRPRTMRYDSYKEVRDVQKN